MSEIVNEPIEIEAKVDTGAEQEVTTVEAAREITDDMDFTEALEVSLANMSTNQRVIGVVMGITPTEIQVDIGRKHAGFVPMSEYSNDPTADASKEVKIGDEFELIIMKTNDAEGTVMLSKKRADAGRLWNEFVKATEAEDTVFEGVVTDLVRGGVRVLTNGVKVFVPASLTGVPKGQALDDLLRTTVRFKVIEVDDKRKRAVGSIRAVLREERKESIAQFWAQLAVEQEYEGTVKNLTNYGAFVELAPGVEGMVYISELSWSRIKHPSDVVKVGDKIKVFVKAIDTEQKKISLGYKRAEDNPWEIFKRDYSVGSIVEVEIVGMSTFGAFAQFMPNVKGLIHISQIANKHVAKPQDELSIGQKVTVKITELDTERNRVNFSIRALLEPEAKEEAVEEEAAEEIVEEATDAE